MVATRCRRVIESSSHQVITPLSQTHRGTMAWYLPSVTNGAHNTGRACWLLLPTPPPPQQIYKENKNLLSALLAKRKHDHHLALCGKSFFLLPLDVENSSVTRGHNGVGESFCPHFIKLFFFFFSKVEFFANRVTTRGIFTEKKGFWRAEGKVIIRRGIETRVTT